MYNIVGSVVVYGSGAEEVREAVASFLNTELRVRLYVVDNSPDDRLRAVCDDERVTYVFNGKNLGFGAGHNVALKRSAGEAAYHVILNPDVYFGAGVPEKLLEFAESRPDVGLLMPKILNPDGTVQHLCKKLPTPTDLILRRFLPKPLEPLLEKRRTWYEMRDQDYTKVFSVPVLSGCFMMLRREALSRVGLFDERYFMYLEDVDLCRRIRRYYETIYYPEAEVYHRYAKGSYRQGRLMMHHITSAVRYFQKWGWYFDAERDAMNAQRAGGAPSTDGWKVGERAVSRK